MLAFFFLQSCKVSPENPDEKLLYLPVIFPDYTGVLFPANIAAPNFIIKEQGEYFKTEIGYDDEVQITIIKKSPQVRISLNKWKKMIKKAAGKKIFFRITVLKDDKWIQYADIKNDISTEDIDEYLVYRLLYPGYELWNRMGIYQRHLENYKETSIVENSSTGGQCMNCHTFKKNSPETMMLHVRGKQGGTIVYNKGKLKKINTKATGLKNTGTYASWHPSGRFIAFSSNDVRQFFHSEGAKPIEVTDLASDIFIYDVEKNTIFTDSLLQEEQYMETFPNWSPDGRTLFFCRAEKDSADTALNSVYYDLYKISFDPENKIFTGLSCLYNASKKGKSITLPRISPDGRYLMFTMIDYGSFSIWHPESDLYILNLSTGEGRRMDEVNSENTESFHTWSSDGKWFVFSSKRFDGLWAQPYFSYFDTKAGIASKPFLLPQKNPLFYETFTKTFNLPELITTPVTIGKNIENIIVHGETIKSELEK